MQAAALTILQHPDNPHMILWVKRRDLGIWVLPGGGIDPGESFEKCALRELKEETGIKGEIVRKAAVLTPINALASETHLFICSCKDPHDLITKSDEAIDAGFYPIDAPPYPYFPLHTDWIKECLSRDYFEREIREITLMRVLSFLARHPILTVSYLFRRLNPLQ